MHPIGRPTPATASQALYCRIKQWLIKNSWVFTLAHAAALTVLLSPAVLQACALALLSIDAGHLCRSHT